MEDWVDVPLCCSDVYRPEAFSISIQVSTFDFRQRRRGKNMISEHDSVFDITYRN